MIPTIRQYTNFAIQQGDTILMVSLAAIEFPQDADIR
jgi:hypothetical protein